MPDLPNAWLEEAMSREAFEEVAYKIFGIWVEAGRPGTPEWGVKAIADIIEAAASSLKQAEPCSFCESPAPHIHDYKDGHYVAHEGKQAEPPSQPTLCVKCGKRREGFVHCGLAAIGNHDFVAPVAESPSQAPIRSWNGRELRHLTRNCADGAHTHCGGVAKFANADNADDCFPCNCACHGGESPSQASTQPPSQILGDEKSGVYRLTGILIDAGADLTIMQDAFEEVRQCTLNAYPAEVSQATKEEWARRVAEESAKDQDSFGGVFMSVERVLALMTNEGEK